jgi:hypothetical protein
MMEGFIKHISGSSNEAKELRKRLVFHIVPMTNPDGVIIGNYRTSFSGNDLNRQFDKPNFRLHPTVVGIKQLIERIKATSTEQDPILSFIDMHGHSRKKNVFIYGPYYPLHNNKYFKMRVIPKLISDKSDMFRFFSCKFRVENSKKRAARIVLWREYNIMNSFTFEASFHGFLGKDRITTEFTAELWSKMGGILSETLLDYTLMLEEDLRLKIEREKERKHKKPIPSSGT